MLLLSDALATPYVLTRRARSERLATIHRLLLADPSFSELAQVAECAHVFGDANVAADYASRLKTAELTQLCARLGVKMKRVQPPPEALRLYARRCARERQHGFFCFRFGSGMRATARGEPRRSRSWCAARMPTYLPYTQRFVEHSHVLASCLAASPGGRGASGASAMADAGEAGVS